MWLINLIFGFFLKRKAKREYRDGRVSEAVRWADKGAEKHCVMPSLISQCIDQERLVIIQAKHMDDLLRLMRGAVTRAEGNTLTREELEAGKLWCEEHPLVLKQLPTKEETPDFVNELEKEFKRGYNEKD